MKQGFRRTLGILTALATGFCLTGCAASGTDVTGTDAGAAHVFAAASLTDVGADLARAFEQEHPGAGIVFNFAGSPALVRQIGEGAPSDLFISADVATMDTALALPEFDGAQPEVIATNHLVLATADGNPGRITGLSDIPGHLIAVCAPEVPCGTLAGQALGHAGIELASSTEEANVSDVVTKIATGAVDAGFIYSTDARTLNDTQDITIIELDGIGANDYPMALTARGRDNDTARAFAGFLTSEHARGILAGYGFGAE